MFVVPADGALCGDATKVHVQGSQINVDATCTLSSPAGHMVTETGNVVVGLLISIALQVQQHQQRSLHMQIMVRELRRAIGIHVANQTQVSTF